MPTNATQRLFEARKAIKAKEYDKARKLLRGLDHPKAQEWLAKLDGQSKAKAHQKARLGTIEYGIIATIVMVLLIAGGFLLSQVVQRSNPYRAQLTETLSDSGVSIRYPVGWTARGIDGTLILSSPEIGDLQEIPAVWPDNGRLMMVVVYADSDIQQDIQSIVENFSDEPNIVLTPIEDVRYGSFRGVAVGVQVADFPVPARAVVLEAPDKTFFTIASFAPGGIEPDPLLEEMIHTLNMSSSSPLLDCRVRQWWSEGAETILVDFLDTTETATQTSRASLAPVVTEMQRLHREFERLDYPDCLKDVRGNLVRGMDNTIEGLQQFLGNSDGLASFYLDQAETKFIAAKEGFEALGFYGYDIRLAVPDTMW